MEAAAPTAIPIPQPAVVPTAPAPSPNYVPPVPTTPIPSMEDGGKTSFGSGIKSIFDDVNIVDIAISAFIVAGVLYSIQYHRYMMLIEKTGYADLSTRLQKLESSMNAAKRKSEANAAGSGTLNMRRRRPAMTL